MFTGPPPPGPIPYPMRPSHGGYRIMAWLAGVVAVVALGCCGILAWKLHDASREPDTAQSAPPSHPSPSATTKPERTCEHARQAASSFAEVLTSIDYRNVDDNFNQVLAGSTGEFKENYADARASMRQMLIDTQASAHGTVVESAVQTCAADKAVVLLFVDAWSELILR